MGRVRTFNIFSNLDTFENFQRFVSSFLGDIIAQFNGKLDFVENIRASGLHSVIFASSSDIQTVDHKLGLVPKGFLVVNPNAAQTVYKPSGSAYTWTDTKVYLQASGALTADIYII